MDMGIPINMDLNEKFLYSQSAHREAGKKSPVPGEPEISLVDSGAFSCIITDKRFFLVGEGESVVEPLGAISSARRGKDGWLTLEFSDRPEPLRFTLLHPERLADALRGSDAPAWAGLKKDLALYAESRERMAALDRAALKFRQTLASIFLPIALAATLSLGFYLSFTRIAPNGLPVAVVASLLAVMFWLMKRPIPIPIPAEQAS